MRPAANSIPTDTCVASVLREHARRRPEHIALRHGERELTYARLDERSSRLAQALRAEGVGAGARVAYLGRTAPELIELLFAVAKLGAVVVPLNWRLAPPELAAVLADAQPSLVVAGPQYAEYGGVVTGEDYEAFIARHQPVDPRAPEHLDDVVLQLYTSGTTGTPKGVLLTSRNLAAEARTSPHRRFDADTVSLAAMPMFHIGGIGWAFIGLWNGATTILVGGFDAEAILDLIERERVTNTVLVPTMIQRLAAVPGAAGRDFSAMRAIGYGAAPMTTAVLKEALRTFHCAFFGTYGLTESTGGVVQLAPEEHSSERLLRSVGRPLPWVELRIADLASGRELPPGEAGEVWIRSENVTPGYYRRPRETAAAVTADGWLRTGDGGYLDDDGYLFLTDRIKDVIVSGGENVYPIEVEEVLARHPDVADVAVIGVPDAQWGETVKAFVVPRPGRAPDPGELVAFARRELAGYKVPRLVELVGELPRTASGKVLKRALRGG